MKNDNDLLKRTFDEVAREFVQLLNTYSNLMIASQPVQQAFYKDIEALINDRFLGAIDKHFSMSLTIAEKLQIGQLQTRFS